MCSIDAFQKEKLNATLYVDANDIHIKEYKKTTRDIKV